MTARTRRGSKSRTNALDNRSRRLTHAATIAAFEALETRCLFSGGATASLVAPTITAIESSGQFTVTYTDSLAINTSSLGNNNILVTGPNSFSQLATFVSSTSTSGSTTATYSIAGPGGSWSSADFGSYTVSVQANQVKDSSGASVAAGAVGSFQSIVPIGSSGTRGYTDPAIADWDTVPDQTFSSTLVMGVVAFQYNGIAAVDFSVNNGAWTSVTHMTLNPQTGVEEYCLSLSAASFADGPVTIQAVAVPSTAGTPRVLPTITEFADSHNSLAAATLYVATTGSDSTGNGTSASPFASILKAVENATDGTTIYLEAGTYDFTSGVDIANQRYITISAAPGQSSSTVTIVPLGIELGIQDLCLQNLSISCSVGEDIEQSGGALYLNDCNVFSPLGPHAPELPEGPIYAYNGCTLWVVGTSIHDLPSGALIFGCNLVRDCSIYNIGDDAFDDPGLVVNTTINNIFADTPADHVDAFQWFNEDGPTAPTWDANSIIYGVKATNMDSQLLFATDSSNIAVVNYLAVHQESSLVSNYFNQFGEGSVNQILLINVTLPNNITLFAGSAGGPDDNPGYVMTDVLIQNSVFYELLADDSANITINNCHIINYDAFGGATFGTDVTGGDAGFTDPAAGDYSPALNSVLLNRVSQPYVPADAMNNLRSTPDDIGALAPEAGNTHSASSDQTPQFTSATSATFSVSVNRSFTVTTSGTPLADITMEYSNITDASLLPAGLTFTNNGDGTATISGTPAAGTNGVYDLNFAAMNGDGQGVTQSFILTVNKSPAITSASSTTFTAGTAGSFTVTTAGLPTISLTETGALPSGVTFINNGNGTATLAGTAATGGIFSITLTASNGNLPNVTQTFVLTIDKASTITSAASTTFMTGSNGSFTVITTGFPNSTITHTGALPSGVTFTDNGNGTATLSGPAVSGSAGAYVLTIHASNGVGATASQTFTLNVDQTIAATTTTLTASSNAITTGQLVALVATVTSTGGLPTGTITFMDGSTLIGIVAINSSTGQAVAFTGSLPVGANNITATYSGATGYATSSASMSETVAPAAAATTTALAASSNSIIAGQLVALIATVTSTGGSPTGTVTFMDGSTLIGTVAINSSTGQAIAFTTALPAGSDNITAIYNGATGFNTSSASMSETVAPAAAATTTALTASSNSITAGQLVALVATVTSTGGSPTGTVTFMDGSTLIGTVAINSSTGQAIAFTTALPAGSDNITAIYNGATGFNTSSASMSETVAPAAAATTTALTASSNSIAAGQLVALVATVTSTGGSPTGTVTFMDGSTLIGTVAINSSTGQAIAFTTALPAGANNITAIYNGSTGFNTSSASLTETVS